MERKLTSEIIELIVESNALKGRLQEANDKSEITIIRWARTNSPQLILPHNLAIIFEFCQEKRIANISDKEDLFATEHIEIE